MYLPTSRIARSLVCTSSACFVKLYWVNILKWLAMLGRGEATVKHLGYSGYRCFIFWCKLTIFFFSILFQRIPALLCCKDIFPHFLLSLWTFVFTLRFFNSYGICCVCAVTPNSKFSCIRISNRLNTILSPTDWQCYLPLTPRFHIPVSVFLSCLSYTTRINV